MNQDSSNSANQEPDAPISLRAPRPHNMIRFKKGLIIALAAGALALLLSMTILALQKPKAPTPPPPEELYSAKDHPSFETLSALPKTYADVPPPPIKLGPPLPGDLGRPILAHQRAKGLTEDSRSTRSEQDIQAQASGVFFSIQTKRPAENSTTDNSRAQAQTSHHLSALQTAQGSAALALDPQTDPNHQQRKLDFLNHQNHGATTNPYALQKPISSYQVMAGSIIAASLISGIHSDLPGLVVAQITQNIYDTVSGRFLLIPQGSRLIGSYDSVVAYGQSRALLVWNRIIMPNGTSIQIDNLPATDTQGYAGLEDEVDYHSWALIKGIALSTMLGVGTELSLGRNESDLVRAIRQSTQQNLAHAGERITEKNLNIQPTITVRPGWPVRVIVHKDLLLTPYNDQ